MGEIKQAEAFRALPRARRNLVFYSEGSAYWPHFAGLVHALLEDHRYPFVYLSSQVDDPGLRLDSPLARTYCIGAGGVLFDVLAKLEADVLVMTMPDLENLYVKRSAGCRHYVYVFHSPVSTHMIYRQGAFDHYDTVFCVGPHHEVEIRRHEALSGSRPKSLFRHGYGRMDQIIAEAAPFPGTGGPPHVLVAPSWGPSGIFETIGRELVGILLDSGCTVTARPHPQTVAKSGQRIAELRNAFGARPGFAVDTDMASSESLLHSDLMISDWSGAAFDYAFGLTKPVLFIDTPRKINNPDYPRLEIEPLEAAIRDRIGRVVNPSELETLPDVVGEMVLHRESMAASILETRKQCIFNIGESAAVGSAELVRLASGTGKPGAVGGTDIESAARARALDLLARAGGGDPVEPPGSVAALLSELLERGTPMTPERIEALENLCRHVDVEGAVPRVYDPPPAPAVDYTPLSVEAYAAMVFVLISAARETLSQDLGLALKLLNAAGHALDIFAGHVESSMAPMLESLLFGAYDDAGMLH